MDSVIFGNPNTDWWKLSFDDVSRREQIIAVDGELQVGFFTASTLMCIPPAVLEQFDCRGFLGAERQQGLRGRLEQR